MTRLRPLRSSGRRPVVLSAFPDLPARRRRWLRPTEAAIVVLLALLVAVILFVSPSEASEPLTYDQVYAVAADELGPGPGAHFAARVTACESSRNPRALSQGFDRRYGIWYRQVGLWQIEATIWGPVVERLYGSADLFDPWLNARAMGIVLREQGWAIGWPYCSRVS